jgi:hypothetical protein
VSGSPRQSFSASPFADDAQGCHRITPPSTFELHPDGFVVVDVSASWTAGSALLTLGSATFELVRSP